MVCTTFGGEFIATPGAGLGMTGLVAAVCSRACTLASISFRQASLMALMLPLLRRFWAISFSNSGCVVLSWSIAKMFLHTTRFWCTTLLSSWRAANPDDQELVLLLQCVTMVWQHTLQAV
eukprot:GABU01008899.1.p3 GENE.GABU01008899.1~~GABU01008899.1.p3  ORF type:complete len:120 (+),score=21.92 GABU01008899.1:215-574(+)